MHIAVNQPTPLLFPPVFGGMFRSRHARQGFDISSSCSLEIRPKVNPSAKRILLAEGSGCCRRLELDFEGEFVLPWGIVRIGLRNAAEGGVAEACAAAAVSDVEAGCVGDIEAFHAELYVDSGKDKIVQASP
jgi:hypothetical protein